MDTDTIRRAAIAFASAAGTKCVHLLASRPTLACGLLDDSGSRSWSLVPVPPGVGTPGLVAHSAVNRALRRIDMLTSRPEPAFFPEMPWTEIHSPSTRWRCHESQLPGLRLLEPLPEGAPVSEADSMNRAARMLRWAATAFLDLAKDWPVDDDRTVCPPTAANLLGPDVDEFSNAESPHWEFLGYGIDRSALGQKAFQRNPAGYLTSVEVAESNCHLWQIGTAIADRLNRLREADRGSALGFGAEGEQNRLLWAVKKMLAYSLWRLRGNPVSAAELNMPTEGRLPRGVNRILARMMRFPEDDSPPKAQLASLLAMFAEGRAFVERSNIDSAIGGAEQSCGYASALLVRLAKCQFRADEELAEQLPPVSAAPLPSGTRRPTLAWYQLAKRIEPLIAADPCGAQDPTLRGVTAGVRLLAVTNTIKAQVLEQWACLDDEKRAHFVNNPPNPAPWGVDSMPFLFWGRHPSRYGGARTEVGEMVLSGDRHSVEEQSSIRRLLKYFYDATTNRAASAPGLLEEITPFGWILLLGAVANLLPNATGGTAIIDMEQRFPNLEGDLAAIARDLALPVTNTEDRPWHDLQQTYDTWTDGRTDEALRTLSELDSALGVRVVVGESGSFVLHAGQRQTIEVAASDGTRRTLAKWQETAVLLMQDRPRGEIEYKIVSIDGQDGKVFRWSESWIGNRLASVGVISPAMAKLCGFSLRSEELAQIASEVPELTSEIAQDSTRSDALQVGPVPKSKQNITESRVGVPPAQPNTTDDLRALQDAQRESWQRRAKPEARYARVALLQWQVDECYRHPLFDACLRPSDSPYHDLLKDRDDNPSQWMLHASQIPSCAEHRRLKILRVALEACRCFGVDILLLPEYSVRPDTIAALLAELPELAPRTSVWAGTYRLPPGMEQSTMSKYDRVFSDWSAILTAIPAKGPREIGEPPLLGRSKKYRSIAADELFFPLPASEVLDPLFRRRVERFDARRYVTELICSEVFLVTNPANLLPLARSYQELRARFEPGLPAFQATEELLSLLVRDFRRFAELTDLQTIEQNRRSIILVPAMTSRTVDYAVLGQAGFLAASLVMVFCNAVLKKHGRGQSCFIGHDSWDRDDDHHNVGLPTFDPYHGVSPGVFRMSNGDRGWLGKNEQALVIADINPEATADVYPRPQLQEPPLKLVAHLPLIESWRYPTERDLRRQGLSRQPCRCDSVVTPGSFQNVAVELAAALFPADQSVRNTAEDRNPAILGAALRLLSDAAEHSPWLVSRREAYEREHANNPQPWPPPVALDWLWIDLGEPLISQYPKIEIPPYRASGCKERLD